MKSGGATITVLPGSAEAGARKRIMDMARDVVSVFDGVHLSGVAIIAWDDGGLTTSGLYYDKDGPFTQDTIPAEVYKEIRYRLSR